MTLLLAGSPLCKESSVLQVHVFEILSVLRTHFGSTSKGNSLPACKSLMLATLVVAVLPSASLVQKVL